MAERPIVAIIDHGTGNLFSVHQACRRVGLDGRIVQSAREIAAAQAIILPGIGAFGTAMETLCALDLVSPLRDAALSGKPLLGICLGMQLLMSESDEFGPRRGLDLISGGVLRLPPTRPDGMRVKVPQVGWNQLVARSEGWGDTLLDGIADRSYMYFVHSYYCVPSDQTHVLSTTTYEGMTFCSSVQHGAIFACQFHPERSGPAGLVIYERLAARVHGAAFVGTPS